LTISHYDSQTIATRMLGLYHPNTALPPVSTHAANLPEHHSIHPSNLPEHRTTRLYRPALYPPSLPNRPLTRRCAKYGEPRGSVHASYFIHDNILWEYVIFSLVHCTSPSPPSIYPDKSTWETRATLFSHSLGIHVISANGWVSNLSAPTTYRIPILHGYRR
jgi:hypothetical protein